MAIQKGFDIITCYHPIHSEIYCELHVKWEYSKEPVVMHYHDGSGYPGSENLNIVKAKMLTYCDEAALPGEDLPTWIDWEKVVDDILVHNEL